MTKAAFAVWDNRIAPVFDVARQLHLVEAEAGRVVNEIQEPLAEDLPVQKAIRLAELGAGVLVCGAISRPLHEMVAANGIQVIPFVAGDLREVIHAWVTGSLDTNAFSMPGCRKRGRFRGMRNTYQEDEIMNGERGMGQGGGRGQGRGQGGGQGRGQGGGQGRGGQRAGRMGGRFAAGAGGQCVCPQCGQREPHVQGIPCVERKCPKCGAGMTRE